MRPIAVVIVAVMGCAGSPPPEVHTTTIECADANLLSFHEMNSGEWEQVWRGVESVRIGELADLDGADVEHVRVTESVWRDLRDAAWERAVNAKQDEIESIAKLRPAAIHYTSVQSALSDTRYSEPVSLRPVVELEFSAAGLARYQQARKRTRPLGREKLAVRVGPSVSAALSLNQPGPRVWLSTGAEPGDFDDLVSAIEASAGHGACP